MDRNARSPLTVADAKRQLLSEADSSSGSALEVVTNFIRRHPLKTALAAGAVGVVLGLSPTARRAAMAALPATLIRIAT